MLKKLNIVHIMMILALPIVLALINPNWIFNVNIADDYIYLGYQLDFPKYTNWSPATDMYFIERISWILPTYLIRQVTSPLLANFIIHLAVYYLSAFSVYGILNRLHNNRVAIIITVLFGQYPLILRSTGWDYPDGFAMALFALTIYFLTQAVGSKRNALYLIGAGAAFAVMFNSNPFNVAYAPALGLYYLLLSDWRKQIIINILKTGIFTALGAGIATGILILIYYALTQSFVYENTIRIGRTDIASRFAYFFRSTHVKNIYAHWGSLFVLTSLLIILNPLIWKKAHHIASENPAIRNYRVILRAMLGLFAGSLAILGIYQFQGYVFIWMHFYNTNWVLVSFLFLGVIFAPQLSNSQQRLYRSASLVAFFIPMLPLIIFTFVSNDIFQIFNYYVLYIALIICVIIALFPKTTIYGLVGLSLFSGALLHDSRSYTGTYYPLRTDVYVADRYMLQDIYQYNVEIVKIINARYDDYSLDTFRIMYTNDPHRRLFDTVGGIYLWSWDRILQLHRLEDQTQPDGVYELVVLSSADLSDAFLEEIRQKLEFEQLDSYRIDYPRGAIDLIFLRVIP